MPVTLVPVKGKYAVGGGGAVEIRLFDPVVDFSPLWQTAALNNGEGYQLRQAIKTPSGEWNGNLAADITVSSEGSNYLKNLRNMYSSTWACMANSPGANVLRLTEFLPDLLYPNDIIILDYGNSSNTRTFAPVDSLFRFVLDKGSTTEGDILLDSPRTFKAFTGPRAEWDGGTPKAWIKDSQATKGDLFASTSPILTGRVEVTLVRLEGRFNLADATAPLLFTAWFRSDAPEFMRGVDTGLAVTQEDGLWKVNYKLWPR